MACTKFLAVPELLEDMLLHLPLQDLLLSEGVCKEWKAAVQSSVKIQRVLFREPIPLKKESENTIQLRRSWETASNKVVSPIFNPFVEKYIVETPDTEIIGIDHDNLISPGSNQQSRSERTRLHRRCASWKQMLVLQLAPSEMQMLCLEEWNKYDGDAPYEYPLDVHDAAGVRFGSLVKML